MISYILFHIRDNKRQYILLASGYVIGIIAGALSASLCSEDQLFEILSFIKDFFIRVSGDGIDSFLILKTQLFDNLKYVAIICVLGLSAIGAAAIVIASGVRGFACGFTISVLFKLYGIRSLALIIFAITPSNILILPAYMYLSAECMQFYKRSTAAKSIPYKQQITRYMIVAVIAFIVMMGGILIESYLIPPIVGAMSGIYIG